MTIAAPPFMPMLLEIGLALAVVALPIAFPQITLRLPRLMSS
ncbi:MAG TPA: hypothetical protein VKP89_01915 [Burkholderiales bacterium]|nr:hypothetical protein [Burkholderiales bacterium]